MLTLVRAQGAAEAAIWRDTPEAAIELCDEARQLSGSRSEANLLTAALRVHQQIAGQTAAAILVKAVRAESANVASLRENLNVAELQITPHR